MTFPNSTNAESAIKDDAVRYIWAGWFIFVIIVSLIGDTMILIASIKYKAIKLPEVIVAFIQHIAVSDILISVTWLFPCAVSLTTDRWVFGTVLCYMRPYLSYPGYQAASLLVCGMTTCKLLILKYPLISFTWTAGQAHKACTVIWFLCLYWPLCFLLVEKDDVSFDYIPYTCDYEFSSKPRVWEVLQRIGIVIFFFVPTITIAVTAVMILTVARRVAKEARQGVRWQGVMTVVLTAAVYSISFLPMTVYRVSAPFVEKDVSKPGQFKITYYRVAASSLTVNVIANFFIYSLTVNSFRAFLRVKAQRITSCFPNITPSQGNAEEGLLRTPNPGRS